MPLLNPTQRVRGMRLREFNTNALKKLSDEGRRVSLQGSLLGTALLHLVTPAKIAVSICLPSVLYIC